MFIIFSRKLKFFRTIGFCPSFRIATRHASSEEKFILPTKKKKKKKKLNLKIITFSDLSGKEKKIVNICEILMIIYVYLFICVRKNLILIQLFDNENRWRLKFNSIF